ncbi:MAG TPA: protein-disulfide reductase DsbD domain-containing protein [Pyrinomonadaceae bacterium]|nr:protein-disulfide reductase DsbD domain-containing protein [Pyrinomonadaceae bacterium]
MTRKTILSCFCLCAIFLSACSPTETSNSGGNAAPDKSGQIETTSEAPPADVVRMEVPATEIKSGGTAEATVKLTVASGYHINANPPSFSYLKATELTVEPGEGVTAGKPTYPSSVTRTFAFSKEPLAVYEGETAIKLPLTAAAGAKKGAQTLKGKLRIQACDEEKCFPPRTMDAPIPVTVK